MNLPRSVGDVLAEHVTLEVECIDRAYLNLYMPKLAYPLGVVGFFKHHRKMQFASGALMDPITKTFVAGIHRYVKDHDLDLFHFVKGERKDEVALSTWRAMTARRRSCGWAGPRRNVRCSAPRSG